MARVFSGITLILWLLAFLSIINQGQGSQNHIDNFEIHGRVYCDPCRIKFETRLSYPIDGVKVQLECKNLENATVSFKTNVKTQHDGTYFIKVPGDHQDDSCEISLKKNNYHECGDIMNDQDKDRVSLTTKSGVSGNIRFANDLGYMTKDINPQCLRVFEELAIVP